MEPFFQAAIPPPPRQACRAFEYKPLTPDRLDQAVNDGCPLVLILLAIFPFPLFFTLSTHLNKTKALAEKLAEAVASHLNS